MCVFSKLLNHCGCDYNNVVVFKSQNRKKIILFEQSNVIVTNASGSFELKDKRAELPVRELHGAVVLTSIRSKIPAPFGGIVVISLE